MTVVIASAVRTPMGSFQGSFATLKASQLGAVAIREAVTSAKADRNEIDSVILGNVLTAGMGQAPARQAATYAGLPEHIPAVTINKVCGSGLEAIIQGVRAITAGDAQIVVAGGMESMTNAPYLLPGARSGLRIGEAKLIDSMVHDGLWDPYKDMHMGSCAEMCAARFSISRADQDEFAIRSYQRAQAATREGRFTEEIVPVEVRGRKGEVTIVAEDEGLERADFDRLRSLPPAFEKGGTVTAGNASSISDGAAALVICSERAAREKGMPILARIIGYAVHANAPEWFTTAPIDALKANFRKLDWTPEDIDLFEINEAFAVVTLVTMQELGLPPERVNVNGGAVALGHPIGASGARIVVTLLHALKQRDKKRGMVAICIGGGEALAMGLELAV